jgi:hypothetical protein
LAIRCRRSRPKAKRAIYISLIGAPSQIDLFDYKPELSKRFKEDLNDWLKEQGERLTGMTSGQAAFPLAPSIFKFAQHGQSGAWVSELLPWHAKMVDDLCIIKSMHTDAINHEPANQLICTGSMQSGKASIGSWLSYGLGSMNEELPSFVVLHATHSSPHANVQAISSRLWGSGFLPGKFSGVSLRSLGDPVLFLEDTPGITRETRRKMIDGLNALNRRSFSAIGDPEIELRMQQYEMAFRMQASVPELTDLSGEQEPPINSTARTAKKRGTFANSALMARRLLERGVRFVQIFHRGWDQHGTCRATSPRSARTWTRAATASSRISNNAACSKTRWSSGAANSAAPSIARASLTETNYGRDHHPRCFTIWMAGGGIKGGQVYGETDEMSYNIVKDPVHIRDLHATILHALGSTTNALSFKFQGLDQRLTGVEPAKVFLCCR